MQEAFAFSKKIVQEAIAQEEYRFSRYAVPFCLALLYTENENDFEELGNLIRKTDLIIKMSPKCCGIILASTEIDGAVKFCQNIVRQYSTFDQKNRIFIGVTSVRHDQSPYDIVSRAFYTLNEAKKHDISTVEDDHVLDH